MNLKDYKYCKKLKSYSIYIFSFSIFNMTQFQTGAFLQGHTFFGITLSYPPPPSFFVWSDFTEI